ncbi:MAG: minor capsid protein [Ruminococcus flavefaciens]|nr:minor capsid protein [Ruminococcus flavefaciens]
MKGKDYNCTFNLKECIRTLGLEEGGRVQQAVTHETLRLADDYIPFNEGTLRDSGHIEGTDIVWGGGAVRYARYVWNGIVYEDPLLHCAGFEVQDGGWRSRKGVDKVPTKRLLEYQGAPRRGAYWVPRMLQNGGREKVEAAARREAGR